VLEYIRQLEICFKDYEKVLKDLSVAKTHKAKLTKKDVDELSTVAMQIDILNMRVMTTKAKVDLNIKRLRFVLPELRAIELTDSIGGNPLGILAEALREAANVIGN